MPRLDRSTGTASRELSRPYLFRFVREEDRMVVDPIAERVQANDPAESAEGMGQDIVDQETEPLHRFRRFRFRAGSLETFCPRKASRA